MMVQQTEIKGNQGLLCLSGRMKKRKQTQENISKAHQQTFQLEAELVLERVANEEEDGSTEVGHCSESKASVFILCFYILY